VKVLDRVNSRSMRSTVVEPVRAFLQAEASSGALLFAAALIALGWANGPGSDSYARLWETELTLWIDPLNLTESLRHWVNEALMTLFFFVVGLEIKRELVTGELSDRRAAALPVMAAFGGALLPVAIFLIVAGRTDGRAGWGIPMATDIAFAIGVLAVLRRRVPPGARVILLSIAIVDDIIAIAVIAVFYADAIEAAWLGVAGVGLAVIAAMRHIGVGRIYPYLLIGIGVWYATYSSGVHATIAGVALALLAPAHRYRGRDVLGVLENRLHPVSAYVVVPLFALANAGVDLRGTALADAATSRLTWAIGSGLLLGKMLGITLVTLLVVRLGVAVLPTGVTTRHVWGLSALAGIGFTVSLFIAELAYQNPELTDLAKIGVLAASLLSGTIGAAVLITGGGHRLRRRARRSANATSPG